MRKLVRKRRVIVVIGFEEFGWRHGDSVAQRLVIGLGTMMPQVCAHLTEESIKPLFASFGLKRGNQRLGIVKLGEAVALIR